MKNRKRKIAFLLSLAWLGLCMGPAGLAAQAKEKSRAGPPDEKQEKKEPLPEKGVYVPRDDGGYVNMRIQDNKARFYFLDEDKVVREELPYTRGNFIYRQKHEKDIVQGLSKSSDDTGLFLTSPRFIPPPHRGFVILNLKGTDGEVAENHSFRFYQQAE